MDDYLSYLTKNTLPILIIALGLPLIPLLLTLFRLPNTNRLYAFLNKTFYFLLALFATFTVVLVLLIAIPECIRTVEYFTPRPSDKEVAISRALNAEVKDGFIYAAINPEPTFINGKSDGSLVLVNPKVSRYPQKVEIYTEADNQLLYSGVVEIGQVVEIDTLLVALPQGYHECIAKFTYFDPETGNSEGSCGIGMCILFLY